MRNSMFRAPDVGFKGASRAERRRADLFFADLMGEARQARSHGTRAPFRALPPLEHFEDAGERPLRMPAGFRLGVWIDASGAQIQRYASQYVTRLRQGGFTDACLMVNRLDGTRFDFGQVSEASIRAFATALSGTPIRLTLTSWLRPDRAYIDELLRLLPACARAVGARGIEFDVEEPWSRATPSGFPSHEAAANYLFDHLAAARSAGLELVVTCQVEALRTETMRAVAQRADLVVPQAYSVFRAGQRNFAVGGVYGPGGLQDRAQANLARALQVPNRPMLMGLAAYGRTGWPGLTAEGVMRLELQRSISLASSGVAGVRYWSWKHISGWNGAGGSPANSYAFGFLQGVAGGAPAGTPAPLPAPAREALVLPGFAETPHDFGAEQDEMAATPGVATWLEDDEADEADYESSPATLEGAEHRELAEDLESESENVEFAELELASESEHFVSEGEDAQVAESWGNDWNGRICSAIDALLNEFRSLPVTAAGVALRVHAPYFMNVSNPSAAAAATLLRYRRAQDNRQQAGSQLSALLRERRFRYALVGKPTPGELSQLLQAAADAGLLAGSGAAPTAADGRNFLKRYGLGIDCSGFVCQAINRVVDLFGSAAAAERIAEPRGTGSGSLKGNSDRFLRITDPSDLCPGDTMWLKGHIRILSQVQVEGANILFYTAESHATPNDVGPDRGLWRLVPDSSVQAGSARFNFAGYRLEHADDPTASPLRWRRAGAHTYSRYRPLMRLLEARGVRSTPLALAVRSTSAAPAPRSAEAPPTGAPAAGTDLDVSPLTQAEVERLAAVTFSDAAGIDAFFARRGSAHVAAWFNTQLAGRGPFRRRGDAIRMPSGAEARRRFSEFWNNLSTAYERPRITLLDFAALLAIVLNETGGDFARNSERCGAGRSDARGRHPGLAYAFDRIIDVKQSYNTLRGNKRAGALFDDPEYVRAHGQAGGAARLANQGGAFGGAWNSDYYPQAEFSTAEDLATNGFIMECDFYKFRGRGVIQTTGRGGYLQVVRWLQAYSGASPVLRGFAERWRALAADTAATTSTNRDWDQIFDQGEVLAAGLVLHSRAWRRDGDYRFMSPRAELLLHVPDSQGNPPGSAGSIYAMGRRISGRHRYGAGVYRDRVIGLLRGSLQLI